MRKKNQNRNAPAFMEYAASMMGRFEYRMLNLEERGLLYTLRLECWVNQNLPSNPTDLAKALGLPIESVRALLPKLTGPFVRQVDGFLQSPDLEDYRLDVQDHRNRLSEAGKKARKNDKLRLQSIDEHGSSLDASEINPLSKDQINPVKRKPVFKKDVSHEEWLRAYEGKPTLDQTPDKDDD